MKGIINMGNELCARPQPVDIYRCSEVLSTDDDERGHICELINRKKLINTPVLKIEKNELFKKRRQGSDLRFEVAMIN
jgi:hypothetical protein